MTLHVTVHVLDDKYARVVRADGTEHLIEPGGAYSFAVDDEASAIAGVSEVPADNFAPQNSAAKS